LTIRRFGFSFDKQNALTAASAVERFAHSISVKKKQQLCSLRKSATLLETDGYGLKQEPYSYPLETAVRAWEAPILQTAVKKRAAEAKNLQTGAATLQADWNNWKAEGIKRQYDTLT